MDHDKKIIVHANSDIFVETTYRIIKDNDFYVYDDDDNEISENHTKPNGGWTLETKGDYIEDAYILEPGGLFYQYSIANAYNTLPFEKIDGFDEGFIGAELWSSMSNYLVPKKNQKYFFEYKEFDWDMSVTLNPKIIIVSEWKCYFDKNKNLTVDKDLINKIKKSVTLREGHTKPDWLARIHPETIIHEYDYHSF
tara:strand:+ start:387 stop:971 length:585 start_codon:yes stop_codon:yes gene_type:complete